MAPNVDQVLAILPFEPALLKRLGGPPSVYVGHPLLDRLDELRPLPGDRPPLAEVERPTLLVLPGSRRSEIRRLLALFGQTVAAIAERSAKPPAFVLPAVPRLHDEIVAATAGWRVRPEIVSGEAAKLAAFRRAHAALAASGTVTLELALAGVPMAVAYRVDPLMRMMKPMMRARSIVLPNIILDENVIPEFLDGDCTPEKLSAAVLPLLTDSAARAKQVAAFARLDELMATGGGRPAELAAAAVIETIRGRQAWPASSGEQA